MPEMDRVDASLSQVLIHIVFRTKARQPFHDPEIRPRMLAYLATVCRDSQCEEYRVVVLLTTFILHSGRNRSR